MGEHGETVLLHRYLCLMAEANEWAEELESAVRYRVHRRGDGVVCCHVYEGDVFVKELSMELFRKRHQALRSSFNLAVAKRGARARPPAPVGGDVSSDVLKAAAPQPPNDEEQSRRQGEVRAAVAEVRQLAFKLQVQLDALKRTEPPLVTF